VELKKDAAKTWYARVAILRFRSVAAARTAAEGWTTEDDRPLGCWEGIPWGMGVLCDARTFYIRFVKIETPECRDPIGSTFFAAPFVTHHFFPLSFLLKF